MNDLKKTLYTRYVTTHFGAVHSYTQDHFESYARYYRKTFAPILPQDREASVLDVGCGLGHFLYFLKQEGYVNHRGIDIGREQIDACRQHVTQHVECVSDSTAYLVERSNSYDAIVFIDVFEHLDDDEIFPLLDAVRVALKAGGRVIVSVPNAACITALTTLYGDMTHRRLFTEVSLTQLLSCAGFNKVQILPNEKKVIRSFRSRRREMVVGTQRQVRAVATVRVSSSLDGRILPASPNN
jgi:2-polyprenyl-3-methyl-5-hydroxy-6-metoxy-1,4-benzoquinol methylase